jgi:hypothetical protein
MGLALNITQAPKIKHSGCDLRIAVQVPELKEVGFFRRELIIFHNWPRGNDSAS